MMRFLNKESLTPPLALAVLLSACGGDGGGPGGMGASEYACQTISGGGTTVAVEEDCDNVPPGATISCDVGSERDAIDGDFDSAASLVFSNDGGTVRLRAITQRGVTYPGGADAGFVMQKANNVVCAVRTLTLRTFLDGEPADTYPVPPDIANPAPRALESHPKQAVVFQTALPFDAVEVEATTTGCPDMVEGTLVYEFCANQ